MDWTEPHNVSRVPREETRNTLNWLLEREGLEPFEVAGERLPAGTATIVPLPLVQRDPRSQVNLPFGDGARRCIGEPLAWAELEAVIPEVVAARRLRAVARGPERMVVRGTVLVPQRSGLVRV